MVSHKQESQIVTAVLTVSVPADQASIYVAWQQQMNDAVAGAKGFISTQVVDPDEPGDDFVVIYRFETAADLQHWMASPERKARIDQLPPGLEAADGTMKVIVGNVDDRVSQPVTAVISVRVHPGREDQYRLWQKRMTAVMSKQPGSIGWTVQEPIPGLQDDWVVMARFDSEDDLAAWMTSDTRAQMLAEAEDMIDQSSTKKTRTSFDGWFRFNDGAKPPRAWQQSALVLLVLFPIVMLELVFVSPFTQRLDISVATFIGNTISVAATGFVLIPVAARGFRWWLTPQASAGRLWAGGLAIAALYAVSIGVMALLAANVNFTPPFLLG